MSCCCCRLWGEREVNPLRQAERTEIALAETAHGSSIKTAKARICISLGRIEHELHHVSTAFVETRLAIREIETPRPHERFVKALRADRIELGLEGIAPAAQRLRIVAAERERYLTRKFRAPRYRDEPFRTRQHATRENVLADKVASGAIGGEVRIVDRDGLHQRPASTDEPLTQDAKVSGPEPFADGFEHLDRHDA